MKREHWLIVYSIGVGVPGWAWLYFNAHIPSTPLWHIAIFGIAALCIEFWSVRIAPADPHTFAGAIFLGVAIATDAWTGALLATIVTVVAGVVFPIIDKRPLDIYIVGIRPFVRASIRILAIVGGAWLADHVFGVVGIILQTALYSFVIIVNRWLRIYLQYGSEVVRRWWQRSQLYIWSIEIFPLMLAPVIAIIYRTTALPYVVITLLALCVVSVVIWQFIINLRDQKEFNNTLTIVNATSRAIINADLDVDALCQLIYAESSKILDTSSFHLGIFEPNTDRFTLKVRIQDQQVLEPMTFEVAMGDGIVGWMRQSMQPLLVFDFLQEMNRLPARPRYQSDNPPRSGIYIPLVHQNTVIGTISVQSALPNAFTYADCDLLTQIANQVAVAIVKARTFQDARTRALQLQAIQDFSAHLSQPRDPDELIGEVLQLIRQYFGYHPIHYIGLDAKGEPRLRLSTAESAGHRRMHQLLTDADHGIIRDVIRTRKVVLSNDVHANPHYLEDDPDTQSELAVPVRFANELVGVLDVQSAERWHFKETDVFVMQTLADQVGLALERARVFSAQREEAWRLNVLLQAAEELNRTIDAADVIVTAARLPLRLLDCRRSCYLRWDQAAHTLTVSATAGLTPNEEEQLIGQIYPETLFQLPTITPINVQLVEMTDETGFIRAFTHKRLLMLVTRGRSTTPGILLADFDLAERSFGEREQHLFNGLAGQIGAAIENALLEQEADNAALLEEEIRLARDIQTSLLPDTAPHIAGWHIQAHWRAARVIGGDFYDYWPLKGPHGAQLLGFVIADVSDKGMAAALFMTLSRSLVRAAALDGSDPAVALMRANRWITRDSESGMFVTIFYGIIDVATGILHYCCAGHNPPLLMRADGTHEQLSSPGMAIGVIEEIRLYTQTVTVAAGDVIVCYTDGVTESFDEHDSIYGVERLVQVVQRSQHHTAETIVTTIANDVTAFSEGRIYDDVTLLVIQRDQHQ